jgi:hypothetical protein
MNDNLRYISLQYIKGDNYEEIMCFKYDVIRKILDDKESFTKDISTATLRELEDAIDTDNKCYIGESFLNDLVNYYNFKDIKEKIKAVRGFVEDYKKSLNRAVEDADETIGDAKKVRSNIIKSLKELVEVLEKLKIDNIGAQMIDDKIVADKYKKVKELLDNGSSGSGMTPLTSIEDIIDNRAEGDDNETLMENITEKITDAIKKDDDTPEHLEIKNAIIDGINKITKSKAGQKYDLIKLLLTLRKLFLYENEQETFKSQTEIENADKLLVLFKTYTKICNRNIGKFDRLFKQNDIIDIDEAFMIESYATFLNKLKKLKKNLESKDKGKLERALTNSLNKLFNLYGINDYEKILNGDDTDTANGTDAQKYIKKLIDDY